MKRKPLVIFIAQSILILMLFTYTYGLKRDTDRLLQVAESNKREAEEQRVRAEQEIQKADFERLRAEELLWRAKKNEAPGK